MTKAADMADKQRARRAKADIHDLLQRRNLEQRRKYLARGRRFVVLDVGQLGKSWIVAVRNWLARKDRAAEVTMDDLTAELRLRGLEPPYEAIKHELALRFAGIDEVAQKKLYESLPGKSACPFPRAKSGFTSARFSKFVM
jgi:hypothetical protein